jgi:hypothetical protein
MAKATTAPSEGAPAVKKAPAKGPNALEIIRRNSALKAKRSNWDTIWQDIANYVMPRKSEILDRKTPGTEGFTDDLYNMTAIRANGVLASGQMDYLMSGRWFAYGPRPELEDDEAKTWFQRCTEIVMEELALSNFYLEAHEMCLNRGAFGTANLFTEEGEETTLTFCTDDVGTFSIDENARKMVDTWFREFQLSARQAVQKYGLDAVGKQVREAYEKDDGKNRDKLFTFIHAIYPRVEDERDPTKMDPENKPIASIYVCVEDKHVCRNSGYDEMPNAVSRFLRWGRQPYGYSPSIEALPTVRQVNFIEQQMDALAEQKAFPRVLAPEGMVDDIDLRASGVTTFDPNQPNAKPEEWMTKGEYDIGLERVASKDKAIREAYHNDLFEMLKQIEREMTAFEVAQRLAEKVAAFSPTFYRMKTEIFDPTLKRVFAICYRNGKFPEPPASVFVPTTDGQSMALAMPVVSLTSKLAMAIKAEENNAFIQMVNILGPISQLRPDILDNYDLDKVTRGVGKNLAVPTDWQNSEERVGEIRDSRAKAQQAAQQMEMVQGAAKAAADMSKATPEVQRAAATAAGM